MLDDIKNKVQRLLAANVMVEVDSVRASDAEFGWVRLNAALL